MVVHENDIIGLQPVRPPLDDILHAAFYKKNDFVELMVVVADGLPRRVLQVEEAEIALQIAALFTVRRRCPGLRSRLLFRMHRDVHLCLHAVCHLLPALYSTK